MDGKYKPGALTDVIVQHSQKNTDGGKKTKVKAKLASLFSPENVVQNNQRKKSKATLENDSSDDAEGYQPSPGIVHETLLKKNKKTDKKKGKSVSKEETKPKEETENTDNPRDAQRKNRKKRIRDETNDSRTVFVGNWPVSLQKKDLMKLFKTCGKIDNVRFRCPPTKDPRIPKKVISIKKNFHPERPTIVGFVCFEEEKSAQKALKLNGREVEGRHIRVDLASKSKEHNNRCSVFIGNLDVRIDEEQIWTHFSDCGQIVSVRIIRDNATGLGKGFCYIEFDSPDAVGLASHLNGSKLASREIRVMRCQENPGLPKKTGNDQKRKPHAKKNFKNKNGEETVNKGKSAKQLKKDKKLKKMRSSDAKKVRKNKAIFSNSFKSSKESGVKMNKKMNNHQKPTGSKSKGK